MEKGSTLIIKIQFIKFKKSSFVRWKLNNTDFKSSKSVVNHNLSTHVVKLIVTIKYNILRDKNFR